MVAFGVLVAYLLTMALIPALLTWFDIGQGHYNRGKPQLMTKISIFIIKKRVALLTVFSLFFLIMSSFISNNVLTERWLDYFDNSFEIRRTIDDMNANLSGTHLFQYEVKTANDDGIFEPKYVATLDKIAQWYRNQPGVAYVLSYADIIKRLNKTFHDNDATYYRVPDDKNLIAQLNLIYEIGLPPELNLADLVNPDRSASLISVILDKSDSSSLLDLDNQAQKWFAANINAYEVSRASGLDIIFAHLNYRNITSILQGTLIALLLISLILIIALKSVKLGLISLVPNLVPAALTYGTWGLLVGEIDLSASIVICMSLGIVVDDTVHFLSKFNSAQKEQHLKTADALRYSFNTVGLAMCITTIVLVGGFLVLATSNFSPTWVTGTLMAMTLFYALITDFLLLPPLLLWLDRKNSQPIKS